MDEGFNLSLLKLPPLLVHEWAILTIVTTLSGGTSLVVSGGLPISALFLLFDGQGVNLTTLLFFIPLEGYVAEKDEHFLWLDLVL